MLLRALIGLALLAGCTSTTAVRVTPDNPTPEGIPLYGHKPILIVGSGGPVVAIIPNLNERYAVRMTAFFASNHSVLELNDNGTLKKLDSNLDSTEALTLLETLAENLVPRAPGVAGAISSPSGVAIYEFVFHDDGTVDLRPMLVRAVAPVLSVPSTAAIQQSGAGGGGSLQPGGG